MIPISNASGSKVHGQFGCEGAEPWSAKAGYVRYNINLPSSAPIYLILRYSKNSEPTTPIRIYIDEETQPKTTFTPENQGDWEGFTETEPIYLGQITSGTHNLTLSTDGQQYGVTLSSISLSSLIQDNKFKGVYLFFTLNQSLNKLLKIFKKTISFFFDQTFFSKKVCPMKKPALYSSPSLCSSLLLASSSSSKDLASKKSVFFLFSFILFMTKLFIIPILHALLFLQIFVWGSVNHPE